MYGKYRIGIAGTHCAGKTTLVEALNKILGYPEIKEVAAGFAKSDRKYLKTQLNIMGAQIEAEMATSHFLSDRTVADNLAYSTLCFEESVQGMTDMSGVFTMVKEYLSCVGLGTEYLASRPYDLIVFIDEMFPIEDNGLRCTNEKYQKWVFEFLKVETGVISINHRIPVLDVTGSTESRIAAILSSLENLDAKLAHTRSTKDARKLQSNQE